ncbi:MAG: tetratricopeptide repeat protein [Catenulispora sp.]|nr:tetratricopeptide repeat protein [Catenulispora sp.]
MALIRFGRGDETAADDRPAEGRRPGGEGGTHETCTTRIVMDLGADNRLAASVESEGTPEPEAIGDPVDFSWPLDADAQEDIRWYIEDYLRTPFGVYDDRGTRIAARFEEWGSRLFRSLFASPPVHEAYQRARDSGCGMELVVRCAAAEPLALPWELSADPAASAPLALRGIAVTRMLTTAQEAEPLVVSGARLRVLMVISRPRGPADVEYHMIARHLLPLLDASGDAVDMVVLRPPTLAGLEEVLAEAVRAGEPFQVVHFDGHGAHGDGPDAVGALTFEGPRGGAHRVPADRVADVLAGGGVPVVVLNACESGRIGGSGVEATVATRLLQGGVSSVVAMAYKAYTAAAAEFMAVFYRCLFAGDRVADAVTAGRRRLAVADLRPSPRGRLPLKDWIVPVHYASRDVRFADLERATAGPRSAVDAADRAPGLQEPADDSGDSGDLAAAGQFVGRDALLYTLEGAARSAKVVLLHGPGGTGKSEVAKAFGRWWRDTGGVDRPEWVIWHSFEPGVASFGLDGVIDGIGQRVLGTEFAQLDPSARRAAVQELLDRRRILLIWDNFESVHSMPDPTMATRLAAAQREELREFLARLRDHGTASVVITSRTDEDWLGPVQRVEVGGLSPQEAGDYADLLLANSPRGSSRRGGREFAELIQWLDGHPLSMRVILPLLAEYEPRQLLADLRGGRSGGAVAATGGRADPLRACVAYSYGHLSGRDQEALWILSLFHGSIDANFLKIAFEDDSEAPAQFRSYDVAGWQRLLDRALAVGLLSSLRSGGYRIHPALPAFVADQWAAGRPESFAQERRAARGVAARTFSALGQFIREQIAEGNARRGLEILEDHRRNFGAFLEYTLEQQMWLPAGGICQGLNAYWELLGLSHEASEWFRRIRDAVELPGGSPPDLTTDAGLLWQQTASLQANWQIQTFHLDEAERTHMSLLMANQQLDPTPDVLTAIANCYHNLGIVAEQRVRWDEAEAWYRKSLAVKEHLPGVPHVSNTYHHLGLLAQRRRRWKEAEAWYRKALAGGDGTGEGTEIANTYHQLGRVAQEQGLWDRAEYWYQQAVAIRQPLDDRANLAKSYYHLGIVAQEQQNWERAEALYRRALIIHESLGNRISIASCYHQLAVLAALRQRWEDAEAWGRKAFAVQEKSGDRVGAARSLLQFGALAIVRGRIPEGLAWTVKGLVRFDSFPHPASAPAPERLRSLVEAFGIEILERTWREVTGEPLPERVREYVTAEVLPEYSEEGEPTP